MSQRLTLFGTSATFTGVSLAGLVRAVDWPSFIGFAGSAVATVVGWWIARRAEVARLRLELGREERQAARDEAQAERDEEIRILLHAVKVHQLQQPGVNPCELSSTSSSPSPSSPSCCFSPPSA